MSVRHSNRPLAKSQRVKQSIRDITRIAANLEVVLSFLTCVTEYTMYDSSDEAIECMEDFQAEIAKNARRLQSSALKLTNPEDILEKMAKSPTQKLCCNIMQASLDAMATADSMFQLEKDKDELISGIWAFIFLLSANVSGKVYDLTMSRSIRQDTTMNE